MLLGTLGPSLPGNLVTSNGVRRLKYVANQ